MNHVNCRKLKAVALLLAGLASANNAWALNPGDILTISRTDPVGGVAICGILGPNHPHPAGSGSCFGMELDAGSVAYTRLRGNNGIVIGSAQAASGSHTGAPNGTESPGIDLPWTFFSNTGMHFTYAPVNQITANSVLDFSGWAVTWNAIPTIDMGKNAHSGYTTGQAQIICNPVNCSNGATYTLAYTATVPDGDISGFGGVRYSVRLEGTVVAPAIPTSVPPGIVAGGVGGSATIRVTEADLAAAGIPVDSGFSHSGGYYDFRTPATALGGTTQVVLPLTTALPAGFVYRKYKNVSWMSFVIGGSDNIMSAPGALGSSCPAPGDPAYGLATAGHFCLQLTITDGGPNDTDGNPDSFVRDPGGVATPVAVFTDTRITGDSGCSLSANPVNPLERGDWWLLLGFVAWLGFVIRRKRMMQ